MCSSDLFPSHDICTYKPNFSGVFQSLASLAQAKASEAAAGESGSRSRQTDTVTPLLSDYYRGLTNWKNLAIGSSGYWNKETGRIYVLLSIAFFLHLLWGFSFIGICCL